MSNVAWLTNEKRSTLPHSCFGARQRFFAKLCFQATGFASICSISSSLACVIAPLSAPNVPHHSPSLLFFCKIPSSWVKLNCISYCILITFCSLEECPSFQPPIHTHTHSQTYTHSQKRDETLKQVSCLAPWHSLKANTKCQVRSNVRDAKQLTLVPLPGLRHERTRANESLFFKAHFSQLVVM